ncbi:MAG TPA: gamma-glutamyltransferase, partial [Candidatus Nitrosotenuis sp.]|nr:gamma-glutamyltransferase [Candidatus Nitrosotenuis sp.]
MQKRFALVCVLLFAGLCMSEATGEAQDRAQGRSMVITPHGIVAAESPLAAQAGAMVLARGGHAVDAAIAANAVMGLVAPMSNGIGGDLFAIVYDAKSGKYFGLNASGWAPKELTIEFLKSKNITRMPGRGIHAVTVPGAVDGWQKLSEKFGRMKLAEILQPAIHYAENGFPVTEFVSGLWASSERLARQNPEMWRVYYPRGRP